MTNTTTNGTANGTSNGHATDSISAATKLRRMLNTDDIVVAPGVYDGFGARIAHEVGFDAIYMTGAGTVASKLGQPDLGFASLNDMLLETAIAALRKMSVVNNDLPARLGDVISYFCAAPDPTVVGGVTIDDLRLRQVQSRMSMSVVYDCLWTWRKHFQTEKNEVGGDTYLSTRDELHYCVDFEDPY